MTTAVQKLNEQRGKAKLVPVPRGDKGVDLDDFMVEAVNKLSIQFDLAGSITDGNLIRTMDGASTIDVTVHDPDGVLMASALWDYRLQVQIDENMWFRLVNVSKDGKNLTLTFEDQVVAWMREHNKPLKVSRNKLTRAEFIKKMVDEIKKDNTLGIPLVFYSPELTKTQPTATPENRKKSNVQRARREGGLSQNAAHLKLQGNLMNEDQINILQDVLDVGSEMGANRKCLVASVMTVMDESTVSNPAGGDADSRGAFQQQKYINGKRTEWPATGNVKQDARGFFKACMALDKQKPSLQLRMLCQGVQKSAFPTGNNYFRFEKDAKAVVDAYGGAAGGEITRNYYKSYQFTRGQPGGPKGENTWAAAQRLAEDVRWRFFVVGHWVYYVADRDLINAKPVLTIDEDSDGILQIDFDVDIGKDTNEATITCTADRWFADPGEVVVLKDTMGPAKGRWLVSRIERPLFDTETTITIRRAQDPKKEPAPELASSSKKVKEIFSGGDKGQVFTAQNANRTVNGNPISVKKHVYDFLELVAGQTSEKILITTGTRHNQFVLGTTRQSDHWTGDAVDLGMGGEAPPRGTSQAALKKGINVATAALKVLGVDAQNARKWASSPETLNFVIASTHTWQHEGVKYQVQVGWLTMEGGDHYNHVHIGVRRIS